jgi:hypothetical protein
MESLVRRGKEGGKIRKKMTRRRKKINNKEMIAKDAAITCIVRRSATG